METVAEYSAAQPAAARPVPGISYRIPIYKLDDRMVLYFAGFKEHYSIYPTSAGLVRALGKELRGRLHSKATIRFSYEDKVPARLIARIAKLRAGEARKKAKAR